MNWPRVLLFVVAACAIVAALQLNFAEDTTTVASPSANVVVDSASLADPALEIERESVEESHVVTTDPDSVPTHRVHGIIVDEERRPVEGARVTLRRASLETLQTLSRAGGHFELLVTQPDSKPVRDNSLAARRASGLAAVKQLILVPGAVGTLKDVDVGRLVLIPSCRLKVRVRQGDAPASDVSVLVSVSHRRDFLTELRTNEQGEVSIEALPPGPVHLRARAEGFEARSKVFVPEEDTVDVELQVVGGVDLRVIDEKTGLGVGGAAFKIRESYRVPAALPNDEWRPGAIGESYMGIADDDLSGTTDQAGRARIEGLVHGARYELHVAAATYEPIPRRPASGPRVKPSETPLTVEMTPLGVREVRWPVVAGEAPVPADGTVIELRHRPGMYRRGQEPQLPPPGRMEGDWLVLEGVAGRVGLIAKSPDGSLTRLWASEEDEIGNSVSFRPPRSIGVVVSDEEGAPVPDAEVLARNQGNNPLCEPVKTDLEGKAILEGLYGGLADVSIRAPEGSDFYGHGAGSIDLELGDGQLETTLRKSRSARVSLTVMIDGVPRLPARFQVRSRYGATIVEEDPVRGELLVEVSRVEEGQPIAVSLKAIGYARASTEIALTDGGELPKATLELVPTTVLRAQVKLPDTGYVSIVAEKFDEAQGVWGRGTGIGGFNSSSFPNGPDGSFIFADRAPGRWRVTDERSKSTSNEVVIELGDREVQVDLDLTAIEWATGRVETEDPAELSAATVLTETAESRRKTKWRPGLSPPKGAWLRDGEFRVQVRNDQETRLVVWHPWLVPAADSGSITLKGGRDGIVLRLVSGDEIRLPVPQLDSPTRGIRIARYADGAEATGEPLEWHHAAFFEGAVRCSMPRGRWTLLVDPNHDFAPLVIRGVEVEGATELPAAEFQVGSTIRVRVLTADGADSPRIYVRAERIGVPVYDRSINSEGEEVALLKGLGSGRYNLRVNSIMNRHNLPDREIELDGVSDLEIEFDLR